MDVAAADIPDLVALVAVAEAMVLMVPPGRKRSTPALLQRSKVVALVSEEEV